MFRSFFFILFFLCFQHCDAQDLDNVFGDASTLVEDTAYDAHIMPDTVLVKNPFFISSDSVRAIKLKKDFAYLGDLDSLLRAQEINQVTAKKNKPLSRMDRFLNSAFFRFFIWLIPISLVFIVLYNLFKTHGRFSKRQDERVQEIADNENLSAEKDYILLARNASAEGAYRLAVKYLFLDTLQQLSVRGSIHFASGKTNYQYVQEIDADKKNAFARLVLNYEYVWYGNINPDRAMFAVIEAEFKQFSTKQALE